MTFSCSAWMPPAIPRALLLVILCASAPTDAQTPEIAMGVKYECPGGVSFQVFSCNGSASTDMCDVEATIPGQPPQRTGATRKQVLDLVPLCKAQTAAGPGAPNPGPKATDSGQTDANGFKLGESVNVATAGGWYAGQIVRANGDSYLVRMGQSVEVWKLYPSELRRIGALTEVDKARGLFAMNEKVQVNTEGRWVDAEIIGELGMEYQVKLADGRSGWASAQHLRRVAGVPKPAPQAGVPPKPEWKSCAGKIEGRYASTAAAVGSFQIVFRSGKATVIDPVAADEFECWMDGGKIYLHKAGQPTDQDMPIDINNDGTLQTPVGEIVKKGN